MPIATKAALLGICVVALVVVTLKFIVPLLLLYVGGLGVEPPIPRWLWTVYPRIAISLFVFGEPLHFIALVAIGIWLLHLPTSAPRARH